MLLMNPSAARPGGGGLLVCLCLALLSGIAWVDRGRLLPGRLRLCCSERASISEAAAGLLPLERGRGPAVLVWGLQRKRSPPGVRLFPLPGCLFAPRLAGLASSFFREDKRPAARFVGPLQRKGPAPPPRLPPKRPFLWQGEGGKKSGPKRPRISGLQTPPKSDPQTAGWLPTRSLQINRGKGCVAC